MGELSSPAAQASNIVHYYMTSSVSGQDEPNLALWLATRASKMELSCPLGIRAFSCKANLSCFGVLSHIILYWPSLFGQDGWILALFCFGVFMDLDFVSVHKHSKKEPGQYPAILTTRLVHNPYLVYTTQVNSALRARWLANSEVINRAAEEKQNGFPFQISRWKWWIFTLPLRSSVNIHYYSYLHFSE